MKTKIYCWPKGQLEENTYVIVDEATGEKVIIDPGYFGQEIAEVIDDPDSLKYILLTHSHGDHIMALPQLENEYPNAILAVGSDEKELLMNSKLNGSAGILESVTAEANIYLHDGDILKFGETDVKVITTPGHTIGGVCYLIDGVLYVGDTLFYQSVGATHFPTGDWEALKASIKDKLFTLPDETPVLSGHGPQTSIGFEKKHNPYV